jgi:hypothetical protein
MSWLRKLVQCLAAATLLGAVALAVVAADDSRSALEQDPSGWTDLLATAGKNLDGWSRAPLPAGGKLDSTNQWSYDPDRGILTCSGKGGHEWLRWDKELGDFIFHVEWRFVPVEGKPGYNSGVYARNSNDAKIYHQAQTGDGAGGYLFGQSLAKGTQRRFDLSKQMLAKDRVRKAGEWNSYEITCRKNEMALWVNGAVTNNWGYCEIKRGYVGLEAEGWQIEFKNVKVKPL